MSNFGCDEGNWRRYLKGKPVNRMQQTLPLSKCQPSDSIRAGVHPLNINSKIILNLPKIHKN